MRGKFYISIIVLGLALYVGAFWHFRAADAGTINNSYKGNITNGLVDWWTFDSKDITSNTTTDRGSSLNHGNRTGTTTPAVGRLGQGLKFNGTNSSIVTKNNLGISGIADRTFSAWVNINTCATYGTIMTSGATFPFLLRISSNCTLLLEDTTDSDVLSAAQPLPSRSWHHVVAVAGNSYEALYVDGKFSASSSYYFWTDNTKLYIGSDMYGSNVFNGVLDDVRVYDRILSASEIKNLYQMGAGATVSKTPTKGPLVSAPIKNGLVGWWTFDQKDMTAASVTDKSGQNNTGYRAGATTAVAGKLGQGLAPESGARVGHVSSTDSNSLDVTNFSIGGWVKSDYSRMGSILSKGSYALKIGADNVLFTEIISGSTVTSTPGELGASVVIHQLIVYNGQLYAATGNSSGVVYRYDASSTWTSVGQPGSNQRATSLAVYRGKLYAGTKTSGGDYGRVYRYDGGTTWTDIYGSNIGIRQLIVYNDKLYAAASFQDVVLRYNGESSWSFVCNSYSCPAAYAMTVHDGKLYLSGQSSNVLRYDGGTSWSAIGQPGSETSIHSLVSYKGKLYAGTGSSAKVWRYESGSWTDVGTVGASQNYVESLAVYNGELYAGVGNYAPQVFRYSGTSTWTNIGMASGFTNGFHTMAVYDGKLFAGIGTAHYSINDDVSQVGDGKIYSYGTGAAIYATSTPMNTGFNHLFSTYDGSSLKLYVNGILKSSSSTSYTVSTTGNGLFIGSSAGSSGEGLGEETVRGAIDDLRIYNRALSAAEVKQLTTAGISTVNKTPVAAGPAGGSGLARGLVGWWTFDGKDMTIATATDKSGNGSNGTRTGTTPRVGRMGQGLYFDGTDDKIVFATTSLGTTQTCAAWVKLATADTDAAIIGFNGSNYCLYFQSGLIYYSPGATAATWTFLLNDNKWHHLVVTRNGTSATLYIDGLSRSVQITGSGALSVKEIGTTNESYNFTGMIDDVRVYNRVLSAKEIQQLYRMGK